MHNPIDPATAELVPPAFGPMPPDDGRALYIEGLIALRNGDADGAAGLLTAALRRQPSHLGMRRNLVRAFIAGRRFQNALLQADACLSQEPDDAELHYARGSALTALGEPVKACAALTRAVALRPNHAASCLNLANAWADLDDLATAERLCRQAIGLDPNLAEAHASLGYILTTRGALPEAIAACRDAVGPQPGFTQGHWNLAVALLLAGDLDNGFVEFEWRRRHRPYQADFPPLPGWVWDGSSPAGKTILIRAEQGMGDTIHFARFLPPIHQEGGSVVLICPEPLRPLLGAMPGVRVIDARDPLPSYDCWADLMSLAHINGTTEATIPAAEGYLRADPALAAAWRARLPGGFKAGLALAGNPRHPNDRRRSVPPNRVLPLPDIDGVTFINLQHGPGAAALGLRDWTDYLTDFAETAALVQALDLVITVDTAVAHLAGALGKPTWLLLPAAPDWRWQLNRQDTPWYDSVRLFRQQTPNDWGPVLSDVFQSLSERHG